jgi:2,3-bisphosphoglycerate-dependent phosphoglycerate mutase
VTPGPPTATLVFETHATTEDNEAGLATGWLPGRLSAAGRREAVQLGQRRRDDGIDLVLCSDLLRAAETASLAFAGTDLPVLHDWRLRECDYGDQNGAPVSRLRRADHLDEPYPGGESWRQAIGRVDLFLRDLPLLAVSRPGPLLAVSRPGLLRSGRSGGRVLVIGHTATRWGLDVRLGGRSLDELAEEDFGWQPGWEYPLP